MFRVRFNPIEKHANELIEKYGSLNEALNCAAFNGSLELVKYLCTKGPTNIYSAMIYASLYGETKEIVGFIKTPWDTTFEIFHNYPKEYLEVVKFLHSRENNGFNTLLVWVAGKGNLEMVQYFVENGANNLNQALFYASLNNHLPIVKYLVEAGVSDLHQVLQKAKVNNVSSNIIEYLQLKVINQLKFDEPMKQILIKQIKA